MAICPKLTLLFFVILNINCILGAPSEDLVTKLPGLSFRPNFKQYSGYLKGDGTNKLHYWFVESSSNPRTDPVVLWLNGGPGCSSMEGLLTEHGPFTVQPDGETLGFNPFSWNSVANMIYLESPAGVGFSYSENANYKTNDNEVAKNNYLALREFFHKFPEFQSHDFYITGESYGGIYVPMLASLVLKDSSINLKGFAVGNGLSSDFTNDNSLVYFVYFHGLLGDEEMKAFISACCPGQTTDRCDFFSGMKKYKACEKEVEMLQQLVWSSGFDPYNLYAKCPGGVSKSGLRYDNEDGVFVNTNFGWPFASLPSMQRQRKLLAAIPSSKLRAEQSCSNDTAITTYLNIPAVREALHIPAEVQKWVMCSGVVSQGYTRQYDTMAPQYQRAIAKKLRLLVYNGDVDMACNFLGDEWFVDDLHVKKPQKRRMWYYRDSDNTKQVGGFVKNFERVTYVTVRGAGHLVPHDKPRQALTMFVNYIQNLPF